MIPPIPEDIFNRNTHTITDMKLVFLYYACWIRRHPGRTFDQHGNKMNILEGTVTNRLSALTHCLSQHDPQLRTDLHRDRNTPTILTTTLKGMGRIDNILRGHIDQFCKIPAGMEFVMSMLAVIAAEYTNNPDLLALYSILTLFEYMFGCRTHEALIDTHIAHKPGCVPVNGEINLADFELELEETSASIHTVRWDHLQFVWPDGRSCLGSNIPHNDCPEALVMYGTSKNNPTGSKHPGKIMINPHLPGSAPVCLVREMFYWAKSLPNKTSQGFIFQGATDVRLSQLIKQTAIVEHLPPTRMHITSLRIGCVSASTRPTLDMSSEQLSLLVQNHQHWLTPGGSSSYHADQLIDGVVKTVQLYHTGSTTLNDTRTRFNRYDNKV